MKTFSDASQKRFPLNASTKRRSTLSSQPLVPVGGNESVVVRVWVGAINAVDLFGLARTQFFVGVQAQNPLKKSLPAQHFMKPGDAACEPVGSVEESRVGVRDFHATAQQVRGNGPSLTDSGMTLREQFD